MAEGGFFSRLSNLWQGFLSVFVGNLEKDNPEAVYEAAINARKEPYKDLKKAVSGIIVLRNKLASELEEKTRKIREIDLQIATAVEADEDDVALVLIQRKDELTTRVSKVEDELQKAKDEAETAKSSIVTFQAEIEKLEREKVSMLAKKETAEARIQIQETLDGMSMQADIKALDNVRDHIDRLRAEADVGAEIDDAGLSKRLAKIQKQAGSVSARAQLDAMKQARAASKAKAPEGPKKSM
jgi:phage shock protein A